MAGVVAGGFLAVRQLLQNLLAEGVLLLEAHLGDNVGNYFAEQHFPDLQSELSLVACRRNDLAVLVELVLVLLLPLRGDAGS